MNIVLLPGLDGTSRMFEPFVAAAPAELSVTRVAFPAASVLSYDELADFAARSLPRPPLVLLGESFSGPLALRLAARFQPRAVILCASFVRAPWLNRLAAGPLSLLLRKPPPTSLVRLVMAGGDRALAERLVEAVSTVDGSVIASRVRMVLTVDTASDVAAFAGRLLYLRAAQDHLVPGRQGAILRDSRPDAELADIDGPHLLLQTQPKECWQRIVSFLATESRY